MRLGIFICQRPCPVECISLFLRGQRQMKKIIFFSASSRRGLRPMGRRPLFCGQKNFAHHITRNSKAATLLISWTFH